MTQASWIEVDLGAVEHNIQALRRLTASGGKAPAICAVVKKNAYGLGAVPIAHRLARLGVDMLAVYSAQEATDLVAKAVTAPILLLAPLREIDRTDVLYRHLVAERLHVSIHDLEQLQAVNALGHKFGIRVPIQPYIDTGMSRSGLSIDEFLGLAGRLDDHPFVRVTGVFTHMATGDDKPEFVGEQMDRFEATVEQVRDKLPEEAHLHAANTFTCFRDRRHHLDMVRPGLGIYGFGPEWLEPGGVIADAPTLRPALRWLSQVIHVQTYSRGTPVGYGSTHKLRRESVIGVVPVGYADGYPVSLSNKGVVRLQTDDHGAWHTCKVLGRVSMDQITVDLTEAAQQNPEHLLGADVEIYSNDPDAPNAPSALAKQTKTNVYELLCRLSPGLPRRHCG